MDDRESSLATADPDRFTHPIATSKPGGSRELLIIAWPLIIANSFTTIQFTIDRAFLSRFNPDAMGASMQAGMVFWLGMSLLFGAAGYTSTFVAQYTGAGRPQRVGPAVWQGIYLSVAFGSLFWFLWPISAPMFAAFGHDAKLIPLETAYFQTILGAATPMGIVAAINGFFSGRGDTRTVIVINAVGTAVHVAFDYALIFGKFGFPSLGIEGAGWALVIGSWASAAVAIAYFLRKRFRDEFASLSGWKPDGDLLMRFVKFGVPSGLQWMLEAVSFTFFMILVGRLGPVETNATTLTFTLNMFTFLPLMGMAQAVAVLVGQRLGENRPEIAEQTTVLGIRWAIGYVVIVTGFYLFAPELLMLGFRPDAGTTEAAEFSGVAEIVPKLLICVAIYSIADAVYLVFSFALRGAGDTRFVMWVTFALAWPVMILPTWYLVTHGYSIYWPWAFATAYVGVMAVCFGLRFRTGKWKSMRVIEAVEKDGPTDFTPPPH